MSSLIERLETTWRPDRLDALLADVHVRGAIHCKALLRAPWGVEIPGDRASSFYIIRSGTCRLSVRDGAEVTLCGGQFAILPRPTDHIIRSARNAVAVNVGHLLSAGCSGLGAPLRFGGDGHLTELLVGWIALDDRPGLDALLNLLPSILVSTVGELGHAGSLVAVLDTLAGEPDRSPDYAALCTRLAEALFVHCVRRHLLGIRSVWGRPSQTRDARLSPVLIAIHREPSRKWTIAQLASLASLSRPAFAARFRKATGCSPMEYLADVRMKLARRLLQDGALSVKEVAARVGYGSTAAFGRAFKRIVGTNATRHAQHTVPAS